MDAVIIRALDHTGSQHPQTAEVGDQLVGAIRATARESSEFVALTVDFTGCNGITYSYLDPLITELGVVQQDAGDYHNKFLLVSGLDEVACAKLTTLLVRAKKGLSWVGDSKSEFPDQPGRVGSLARSNAETHRYALVGASDSFQAATRIWVWSMEHRAPFRVPEARAALPGATDQQIGTWLDLLRRGKFLSRTLPGGPSGGSVFEPRVIDVPIAVNG